MKKPEKPNEKHPIDDLLERAHARGLRLFIAAEIDLADMKNLRVFKPKPNPTDRPSSRHTRRVV